MKKLCATVALFATLAVAACSGGTQDAGKPDDGAPTMQTDAGDTSDRDEPDTGATTAPDSSSVEDGGEQEASTPPAPKNPVVTLSASSTAVYVRGDVTLSATASGPNDIVKVVLYKGTTVLTTLDHPPYTFAWSVQDSKDNGTYAFRAEATDSAGHVGTSPAVSVAVKLPPDVPSFVAASAPVFLSSGSSLALATPSGVQTDDLLIALIDAAEGSGPHTLTVPAGWTPLGGYPIHNKASAHSPYVISDSQNHGTWIFHKFVVANEPASTTFAFESSVTARGTIVSYRGVSPTLPIHDKSGGGFYGMGDTHGFGMGNTQLDHFREVHLVTTALTQGSTYTILDDSGMHPSNVERVNSGEQPNGLNVVAYDYESYVKVYDSTYIENKQSPSASPASFLFSATTLVLTPR